MISAISPFPVSTGLETAGPASRQALPGQGQGQQGFGDVMASLFSGAAESLRGAEASAIGGITGTVPLQTVVENVMAAERTLQASIAVRDKIVSAYLEISRMQI